jgi:hypothetical protein
MKKKLSPEKLAWYRNATVNLWLDEDPTELLDHIEALEEELKGWDEYLEDKRVDLELRRRR